MTGTLKARIEKLERPAEKGSGGLVWLMPVPEDEAVPEPESHGGLRIIYGRQADLDAIAAARVARG